MKYLLVLLASISLFSVFAPTTASADPYCEDRRIVRYLPCGRPVFSVYEICGRDPYGRPIGHWVTQSSYCGCSVCNPRPYCPPSGGYSHHHHDDRRGFGPGPGFGPPRRGASFSFSFGR